MKFVNLTPHTINIFNSDKQPVMTVLSSGHARCSVNKTETGNIDGVQLFETTFGEVEGLPPAEDDTILIVSLLTRQALPERDDLYSPGELLRDENGQPVGCIGLSR